MKVYITKYALTQGIITSDVVDVGDNIVYDNRGTYYHKPDWHESMDEAIQRAEAMRQAKIKSLQKQIKKLEDMRFE
jgi:hypothetical protein